MLESVQSLYVDMIECYKAEVTYPTGMPLLCSQLQRGLNVIAGRPSMGSTTTYTCSGS